MTTRTNITINKKLLEKAHSLGINVSKLCENRLKQVLEALEGIDTPNTPFLSSGSFGKESEMVRAPRFEPGSSAWQASSSFDWLSFEDWVRKQNLSYRWEITILGYARQYYECVLTGDLSALQTVSDSKRPNILKALSAVSKFAGCHESYLQTVKKYGFKWTGTSSDELIARRVDKIGNPDDIFEWIRNVKKTRPKLQSFMDFMACTGLRLVEAVNSHGLIVQLNREKQLNNYYKVKTHSLEHYHYRELFLRRSKKAFLSFVPDGVVKNLVASEPFHNTDVVIRYLQRKNLKSRFGDIRELHASFMSSYLNEAEINFLHGRITGSVFMRHYFNPSLVPDLGARALKGETAILEKL